MSDNAWSPSLCAGDLQGLQEALEAGKPAEIFAPALSAQAFTACAIQSATKHPWVVIVDSPRSLGIFRQDMEALTHSDVSGLVSYPAWESFPIDGNTPQPELVGERLNALTALLSASHCGIILTSIQALLQRTLKPSVLSRQTVALSLGNEHDPETLASHLQEAGFTFTREVDSRGQASLRGGLLDVWPLTSDWPIRLEFFGDVVDSIRAFDPTEQTSIEKLKQIAIPPARDWDGNHSHGRAAATLLSYIPDNTGWIWCDPASIRSHADIYESALTESERHWIIKMKSLRASISRTFGKAPEIHMESSKTIPSPAIMLGPCPELPGTDTHIPHPDILEKARRDYISDLVHEAINGRDIHIFFDADGMRGRFLELYGESLKTCHNTHFHIGRLSEGFAYDSGRLMVVAQGDLYGYRKEHRVVPARARGRRKPSAGPAITSLAEIQPGDLVVHVEHGIGKYLGLYEIEFDGRLQEVLAIEYAGKSRLYVPVSQTHLLSRYIGVGRTQPDLHALGGRRWAGQKRSAERAIEDMAAALLDTQAAREALEAHTFAKDTPWQHEFEASFPYHETTDQERAVQEVKEDMERTRPMDRLICGDVGYGKTEVAMRAAFKAVMDGKQVAILVPTTVLAQQHYHTFSERMAAFPIAIEMLSRFRTRSEQDRVVQGLRQGAVDIVIGTHRLTQADIAFKDLGLVIIDEEQRFGVAHKERLKQLSRLVDVLTLTATPIPRTLYMSLTGARDMSTIQTPPQERLPVETIVTEFSESVVRQAILHELNRDGQVFYLHNRVKTIERIAKMLTRVVPEARVAIAHGQMGEKNLSSVMEVFVRGEVDVLLCTTIIESGLDIPNVNTILIDRADRFGLSELYQLRGRVGRYKHRAYAYLLLPRHGQLFDTARKRIHAIRRYSRLGSGFKLALRDLEIRGAGNMLGAQQSGHIASIGFDLYCQLLKRSVALLKGEAVAPLTHVDLKLDFIDLSPHEGTADNHAAIPYAYIEDETLRVGFYRRIASASSIEEVDTLRDEFRDRFGPLPEPLKRLLYMARIRIMAARSGFQEVTVRDDRLMLRTDTDYFMVNRKHPRLLTSSASERLQEILQFLDTHCKGG